jgi:hypothetical protein
LESVFSQNNEIKTREAYAPAAATDDEHIPDVELLLLRLEDAADVHKGSHNTEIERSDQAGKRSCSSAWRTRPAFAKESECVEHPRRAEALLLLHLEDAAGVLQGSRNTKMERGDQAGKPLLRLEASTGVRQGR